jgi:hypothetical protein
MVMFISSQQRETRSYQKQPRAEKDIHAYYWHCLKSPVSLQSRSEGSTVNPEAVAATGGGPKLYTSALEWLA